MRKGEGEGEGGRMEANITRGGEMKRRREGERKRGKERNVGR